MTHVQEKVVDGTEREEKGREKERALEGEWRQGERERAREGEWGCTCLLLEWGSSFLVAM